MFCSFNCARAHSAAMGGYDAGARATWLTSMLRHMFYHACLIRNDPETGPCVYDWKDGIRPAPSRLRLNIFGGDMTIEEFRSNFIVVRRLESPVGFVDNNREVRTMRWTVSIPQQPIEKPMQLPEEFEIQERIMHLKYSRPNMTRQQEQVSKKRQKIDEIENNLAKRPKQTIHQQTYENKMSKMSSLMNKLNIKITNHETI